MLKFLNFFKKEHTGAIAPEFRRYSAPPMPKVAPCKKEDEFPDFDTLCNTAKDAKVKRKEKCFSDLINRISSQMKDNAARGLFETSSMVVRQSDYSALDLSNTTSIDCQSIRDYIISKDSRFSVDIEPLDDLFKKRWLKEDGVKITVRWFVEDEIH